jgi:hypothetical protein
MQNRRKAAENKNSETKKTKKENKKNAGSIARALATQTLQMADKATGKLRVKTAHKRPRKFCKLHGMRKKYGYEEQLRRQERKRDSKLIRKQQQLEENNTLAFIVVTIILAGLPLAAMPYWLGSKLLLVTIPTTAGIAALPFAFREHFNINIIPIGMLAETTIITITAIAIKMHSA